MGINYSNDKIAEMDAAATRWATTMTVLNDIQDGLTAEMAIDAMVARGSQTRGEVLSAVKGTLAELLDELDLI